MIDERELGQPFSERVRQSRRTMEAYLKAGARPRWMDRVMEVDQGIAHERARLAAAYRELQRECAFDRAEFARRWRAHAESRRYDELNDLIRQHNEWYPIERDLPHRPAHARLREGERALAPPPRAERRLGAAGVPGMTEVMGDSADRRVVLLCEHDDLHATWSFFGPGRDGADLHVHHHHTDMFYVLEGEFTLKLGSADGVEIAAPAGTFIRVPPMVVHGFRNASDADVRYLNLHAPGMGFASFLRDLRDGRPAAYDQHDPPADGVRDPVGGAHRRARGRGRGGQRRGRRGGHGPALRARGRARARGRHAHARRRVGRARRRARPRRARALPQRASLALRAARSSRSSPMSCGTAPGGACSRSASTRGSSSCSRAAPSTASTR